MAPSGLLILLWAAGLAGQVEPPGGAGPARSADLPSERSPSRPPEAMRVVVTAVESSAPGPGALPAEALGAALERGLAAGGLDVIAHRRVDAALSRHPELRNCRAQACRARLGRILGARLCAEARLRGAGPRPQITVSIFCCATGAPLSIRTAQAPAGTSEQAAEAVVPLAERTAVEAAAAPTRRGSCAVGLEPAQGERRRALARSTLFWSGVSLAGAGFLALAAGATLWGLDGRVYDRSPWLERVYETKAGGIVVTSLGIGALVGGVAMALWAWRRAASPGARRPSPRAPLTVTVDPTRGVLGLSGSF